MTCLMGIDVGTSSLKVLVVTDTGEIKALASRSYQFDAPQPGFSQQDPDVWWLACQQGIREALQKGGLAKEDITAVSFSGQMHGVVMLDRAQHSVRPAILHNDARSSEQVRMLRQRVAEKQLQSVMMNPVYTGFMLASLFWLKENEPENFARIDQVCLPKDYLKLQLTGTVSTDYSDASATLAFDVKKNEWSRELLALAGLPREWFPACYQTCDAVGTVTAQAAAQTGLAPGTIVVAGGADAVMQGIGNGATSTSVVTSNIGSSGQICFQSDVPVENPALTTNTFCGYQTGRWITMGAIMHAGLALKWFNNLFDGFDYNKLNEEAAASDPGSGGLVFLPYLNGERTPHMDPDLSGMFLGCKTGTSRGAMARAVMEGVAFALNEGIEVCEGLGLTARTVVASGGGAQSPLWRQIQADVFAKPVRVAKISEQAALGAAIAAGVGAGVFHSVEDGVAAVVQYQPGTVQPNHKAVATYQEYYAIYKEAYAVNNDLLRRVTRLGRRS